MAGHGGEQFALPEAVSALREERRRDGEGRPLGLSAADPLNLLGIVLPGVRLPAVAGNRLVLLDGEVAATRTGERVDLAPTSPDPGAQGQDGVARGQPRPRGAAALALVLPPAACI